MTEVLKLSCLTVRRDHCPVVDDVSLSIHAGECVGLIGPNGAGKTTMMRAALGLLPHEGAASLAQLSEAARAKHCAWLPQAREIAWPVSVETLVRLGRLPHRTSGAKDQEAVIKALSQMGLENFATRTATELSGGEQGRVLIARALAQETPLIMADEPIAGLDPAAQVSTMRMFAEIAKGGRSVLCALHDLGLAARYCQRLILLDQGRIVADGTPSAVLTPKNLAEVFHITAHFEQTSEGPVFQALDVLP